MQIAPLIDKTKSLIDFRIYDTLLEWMQLI